MIFSVSVCSRQHRQLSSVVLSYDDSLLSSPVDPTTNNVDSVPVPEVPRIPAQSNPICGNFTPPVTIFAEVTAVAARTCLSRVAHLASI